MCTIILVRLLMESCQYGVDSVSETTQEIPRRCKSVFDCDF